MSLNQKKKKKNLKELIEKKKLKNMNFKNIPQLFLNVLGNQTLQSKIIQTQKHATQPSPFSTDYRTL